MRSASPWADASACAGLAAALALGASSCAGDLRWPKIPTQRYPGPMPAMVDPLPPGTEQQYEPGPEEVVVVRHADPVQLRPAGQLSAFRMPFYDKIRRVRAGSWVYGLPGGRSEIIWPNGSTISLFGRTVCVIGSQSRGEPAAIFFEVERVDLNLIEGEVVKLLGGSELTARSGPIVVARVRGEVLRLKNQAKTDAELAFREELFLIEPGHAIDLPLLEAGGRPDPVVPGARRVRGAGFELSARGEVTVLEGGGDLLLRAHGEHEIRGVGQRIELLPGESIRIGGLRPAPVPPSEPVPEPAPEPEVREADPEPEEGSGASAPASAGQQEGGGEEPDPARTLQAGPRASDEAASEGAAGPR